MDHLEDPEYLLHFFHRAPFTLQGSKLAEDIKADSPRLGIKASGLHSTSLTLTFCNMKAYVTVAF